MSSFTSLILRALVVGAALVLAACGSDSTTDDAASASGVATASTTFVLESIEVPDEAATLVALPSFHVAPVLLDEPSDIDTVDNAASARGAPHLQAVPPALQGLSSQRLTPQRLEDAERVFRAASKAGGNAAPMASTAVATYTPAQIRAAYGLPALPAIGASLTAVQAAQLGAGQTVYIVDAMHDPNVVAELAAFNQRFGLPACTTKAISATAALPLAAASASACEFSVVYSTAAGAMTATAPAYDAGWATEITLDVQWVHATAPLARIVLIEAPDASVNSLIGAIKLANAMGPGIVSMSFGANEGSWTASVDAAFTAPNMTYLAATGDSGAAVSWPSVSSNVVAVGGTTLSYSGTGTRSEVTWSGTGGGTSAYTARPSYQTSAVPGMGTVARRTVADVAFNADPSTGQYVATQAPGSATITWISAGGTSLSTPQWAGLIAVANAQRLRAAKAVLGMPHAVLYGAIATVPGTYASAFADITKGSHGSCATCAAGIGYDRPTGLGTPNAAGLLTALTGTSSATAPVVASAAISGKVGTALSFTVSVTAPNPVAYALSSAPTGMTISTAGVVTWAAPVAGTYAVKVTATDTKTGLSGSGTYTVTIAAATAPVVASATISGKAGTALSFQPTVTASNPLTYALSNAPGGMSIGATGVVSWAKPVAGTYAVKVTATDTKTKLSGSGTYTVVIAAAATAPVVTAATVNGSAGQALAFKVGVTAPNAVTYTLSGAPSGVSISTAGVLGWANPVAGSYAVTVIARDSKTGLTGQGVITLNIAASGLVITANPMTGVAGKPLSGTIAISAPGATSVQITLSGVPLGMMFSISGTTLTATWANPVRGNYTMTVSVVDSKGRSATKLVPITVT